MIGILVYIGFYINYHFQCFWWANNLLLGQCVALTVSQVDGPLCLGIIIFSRRLLCLSLGSPMIAQTWDRLILLYPEKGREIKFKFQMTGKSNLDMYDIFTHLIPSVLNSSKIMIPPSATPWTWYTQENMGCQNKKLFTCLEDKG